MGAGEREQAQPPGREPTKIIFSKGIIAVRDAAENVERDTIAGNGVFDGAQRFDRTREKSQDGLGYFGDVGFTVDLDIWEFPKVGIHRSSGPLSDEIVRISLDYKSAETSRGGRSAAGDVGQ